MSKFLHDAAADDDEAKATAVPRVFFFFSENCRGKKYRLRSACAVRAG